MKTRYCYGYRKDPPPCLMGSNIMIALAKSMMMLWMVWLFWSPTSTTARAYVPQTLSVDSLFMFVLLGFVDCETWNRCRWCLLACQLQWCMDRWSKHTCKASPMYLPWVQTSSTICIPRSNLRSWWRCWSRFPIFRSEMFACYLLLDVVLHSCFVVRSRTKKLGES